MEMTHRIKFAKYLTMMSKGRTFTANSGRYEITFQIKSIRPNKENYRLGIFKATLKVCSCKVRVLLRDEEGLIIRDDRGHSQWDPNLRDCLKPGRGYVTRLNSDARWKAKNEISTNGRHFNIEPYCFEVGAVDWGMLELSKTKLSNE